jgi:hypothetical protein
MHRKSGAHGTEAEKRTEFGEGIPEVKKKNFEDPGVDGGFY